MQKFLSENLEDLKALRHALHRQPELGFSEVQTSAKVREILTELGLPFVSGLGKTGIVATVKGTLPDNGRRIGLRADMDALPIHEKSDHDHCSEVEGCMHACGHDGHTTMMIGVARYLATHRDFAGTIYLIFQPAEEKDGGGRAMVEDGLFEQFPMDRIFGLHNWPYIEAGKIAVLEGPAMAANDVLNITIKGSGGHGGATPHQTIDPVRIAGSLIPALHTIVSREIDPQEPAVLSLCSIQAGDLPAFNVIPDTARLSGTVRTFAPEIRDRMEAAVKRVCAGIAAAFGAEIEVDYFRNYPATINDVDSARFVKDTIRETFAEGTLDETVRPSLAGEDFSFMLNECPGAYAFLGSGTGPDSQPLHSPFFDFNDDVIPVGIELLVSVALRALK